MFKYSNTCLKIQSFLHKRILQEHFFDVIACSGSVCSVPSREQPQEHWETSELRTREEMRFGRGLEEAEEMEMLITVFLTMMCKMFPVDTWCVQSLCLNKVEQELVWLIL